MQLAVMQVYCIAFMRKVLESKFCSCYSNIFFYSVVSCGVIMLFIVVLTFEAVDNITNCDNSNESY